MDTTLTETDAAPGGRAVAVAAQRVEQFFAYLEGNQIERAVDHLGANHPNWSADTRNFMISRMQEIARVFGPITGVEGIGIQEFGTNLVRFNYLVRVETTGLAFAILMFKYGDEWILENFCYTDDLDDATESGSGIFICSAD